jgi:hypothetical protein
MITGPKRPRAADSPGPKQLAEMFFRFGVNGKIGIAGFVVFRYELSDPLELRITVRGVTAGEVFGNLASPQVLLIHPVPNHRGAHWRSHCRHRG